MFGHPANNLQYCSDYRGPRAIRKVPTSDKRS
jgi:hypothetical protein